MIETAIACLRLFMQLLCGCLSLGRHGMPASDTGCGHHSLNCICLECGITVLVQTPWTGSCTSASMQPQGCSPSLGRTCSRTVGTQGETHLAMRMSGKMACMSSHTASGRVAVTMTKRVPGRTACCSALVCTFFWPQLLFTANGPPDAQQPWEHAPKCIHAVATRCECVTLCACACQASQRRSQRSMRLQLSAS